MMSSEEKWYDDFNWVGAVTIALTVILLICALNFSYLFPEQAETVRQIVDEVEESNQRHNDKIRDFNRVAKQSHDCDELKQLQLDLISYGVNPESWTPRMSDKSMKIAQERYDLLC